MDADVESQRRYLESHPDTLSSSWPTLHALLALQEMMGGPLPQREQDELGTLMGQMSFPDFDRIRGEVLQELGETIGTVSLLGELDRPLVVMEMSSSLDSMKGT